MLRTVPTPPLILMSMKAHGYLVRMKDPKPLVHTNHNMKRRLNREYMQLNTGAKEIQQLKSPDNYDIIIERVCNLYGSTD